VRVNLFYSVEACCDVAFLGKDYAEFLGCHDMLTAVHTLKEMTNTREEYKNEKIVIICPWGKHGAGVIFKNRYVESKAFPAERIVDTLDTFCGAVLFYLNKDFSMA
jgi:hypothetical protein